MRHTLSAESYQKKTKEDLKDIQTSRERTFKKSSRLLNSWMLPEPTDVQQIHSLRARKAVWGSDLNPSDWSLWKPSATSGACYRIPGETAGKVRGNCERHKTFKC